MSMLTLLMNKLRNVFDCLIFFAAAIAAVVLCWNLWSLCTTAATISEFVANPMPMPIPTHLNSSSGSRAEPPILNSSASVEHNQSENINGGLNHGADGGFAENDEWETSSENFYADPDFTYTVGKPIKDWDRKRQLWLKMHPWVKNYTEGGNPRILMLTGSQAQPCKNPIGDHLLLRFFKNKQDYCRLHGLDLFYNMALLQPQMITFWAKIPLIRAAMVAHPEAEWIWWIDSDAAVTDMEFVHPLEKYRDFNLVVHGWESLVYEKRSWLGLNAGIFLIRNCEWSMEFMERWSSMGPQSPLYVPFGKILSDVLPDRAYAESDDQSALVYLMIKERDKWGHKIFIEHSYYFHGYWLDLVGTYENITRRYRATEHAHPVLKRRHAEKTHRTYAEIRAGYLREENAGIGERRPFVTHFTGCQPCSGNHNKLYEGQSCWNGMERALNYADDQVLRIYGFRHDGLHSDNVSPVPFDE